jgi:Uma2 family endonuclease
MVMATVIEQTVSPPLLVRLRPVLEMTDEQFFQFCQINRELRMERTAKGDLLIMPPTGGRTGVQNIELSYQLRAWVRSDQTGVAFDSSTGFILPNGATRSPDAAWVSRSRLASLTEEQKEKFLPVCPEFVVELRSISDWLAEQKAKLREYIENGAQLGLLIDPQDRRVYMYRPGAEVETLENPDTFPCDPVLPDFVLNLNEIWEADF